MSKGLVLYISDANGIYIPQIFAERFNEDPSIWKGVSKEDVEILLSGPEHDEYWDAWHDVTQSAEFIDKDGHRWVLWQEGDLWAYCNELMTAEEYRDFFGEDAHED